MANYKDNFFILFNPITQPPQEACNIISGLLYHYLILVPVAGVEGFVNSGLKSTPFTRKPGPMGYPEVKLLYLLYAGVVTKCLLSCRKVALIGGTRLVRGRDNNISF